MKQTVTSKYEPKLKNVTWIDMSTGHPVQKNFINGMWRPTGGGGSGTGTSNPTEADATKVWQVTPVQKGVNTEEIVIVPEQNLVNEQELEYNDKFVPGAQCVAVINGVEYRGEVAISLKDYCEFVIGDGLLGFSYNPSMEVFQFFYDTESPVEVTAKLSIIEETPIYDYNWAPGVKIPIPTAEDEGKILVVTKVEGDNTSTIVPEQEIPANGDTPLIDVDLTKFVVGNTVKVTIVSNSQTITATEIIVNDRGIATAFFSINGGDFEVWQEDNLLYTNAVVVFGSDSTIKLEYIESNYEYQLQENSGGGGSSTSDILWPAMYNAGEGNILATFVPEDVEPNTWCMVCGKIHGASIDTCLPVLIESYGSYAICNATGTSIIMNTTLVDGGSLLKLSNEGGR